MEIFISIDGVLRNIIQKFNYHYDDAYFLSELDADNKFEYSIIQPITNNNLLDSFKFQSIEEFEFFLYIEYPLEIFGHSGVSYPNVISDLNKIIAKNQEHNFTIIGLDELGNAKPSTLFFLSKNGFKGDNIKFIKTEAIENNWIQCDYWITDNKKIIDLCPKNKIAIKFNTSYNEYFTNDKEISKLSEIEEIWSTSLEKPITLTWTESPKNVE